MTRQMFAGAVTPAGFINYFDAILPLEQARRRYYLKGSSGSGKGTFIKRIAETHEAAGFMVERFHCANAAYSLDAVTVPEKGLCLYDATAPHNRDPELPGIIDIILDFAAFLDTAALGRHVAELRMLLRQKRTLTEKAYGYFAAAGNIRAAELAAYESALRMPLVREVLQECLRLLPEPESCSCGSATDRKLFLSAVTPDGPISFADSVLAGYCVYGLSTSSGAGTNLILNQLRERANAGGLVTESFYTPLALCGLQCLLLPKSQIAFLALDGYEGYTGTLAQKMDIGACLDQTQLQRDASAFEGGRETFRSLLAATIELMRASRTLHDRIEEIYSSAMDFSGVDALTERIMAELLS